MQAQLTPPSLIYDTTTTVATTFLADMPVLPSLLLPEPCGVHGGRLDAARHDGAHLAVLEVEQAGDGAAAGSCSASVHEQSVPTPSHSLVTLSLIAAGCMPDCSTMRAAPCIAAKGGQRRHHHRRTGTTHTAQQAQAPPCAAGPSSLRRRPWPRGRRTRRPGPSRPALCMRQSASRRGSGSDRRPRRWRAARAGRPRTKAASG